MRKLRILGPLKATQAVSVNAGLVHQHDFRNDDGARSLMRLFKLVSACLALGLFAFLVSAEEKLGGTERCSSERCSFDAKQDEPVAREPAEMVKKKLSEFDNDADSMLSVRELTTMFTAIRKRSLQSRVGQSRAKPVRRGLGAKKCSNEQSRPPGGCATLSETEGGFSAQSNQSLREKSDKSRTGRGHGPRGASQPRERPGGTHPDPPNAE